MKRLFLLLIPFFILLSSCSQDKADRGLSILAYNMYLLFDSNEDGDEYYPFTHSGGYGSAEYESRIRRYRDFFLSDEGEADIYILSEIESEDVLVDLMKGKMRRKGYKYYGICSYDTPISVGFISRIPVKDVKVHSNDGPRDILEIEFIINGSLIKIFTIHAKSRLDGGQEERRSTFEHLSYLMSRSYPSLSIAAGDFNEDPRQGPDFLRSDAGLDNPLKVTSSVDDLLPSVFYSPSLDGGLDTYFYQERWYSYDNIILSAAAFDGIGLEYVTSYVVYPEGAVDELGRPIRYEVQNNAGYSDHLAIKCILEYH